MITAGTTKLQWNYFLALEQDLEKVSRFIEFAPSNFQVYSIELAHILLSASSEVDVIMKQICSLIAPRDNANNINDYRKVIKSNRPDLINETVYIDRYSINFNPWENWGSESNPNWWKSYNNVKHERNQYFQEANLQNTINALGGLLVVILYYYQELLSKEKGNRLTLKNTTYELNPSSSFIRLKSEYYYDHIVG